MQQNQVKQIVEGGILSAVAVVLSVLSLFVPFANVILPIPIILLGVRHGYKWSILAVCVSGLLTSMIMQPLSALMVVVFSGLTGIVMGYAIRAKYRPFKVIFFGSVAVLFSQMALLAISFWILGENQFDSLIKAMADSQEYAINFYQTMHVDEETLRQQAEMMKMTLMQLKILIPAIVIVSAMLMAFVNYIGTRLVLGKLGYRIEGFPPFAQWHLPLPFLYFFIISAGLMYWGRFQQIDTLVDIGLNLVFVSGMFLFVHGMALFYFLADKYKLSRFLRSIILVLIFINLVYTIIVILAAAFDIVFDYRRLNAGDEL